MKKSTKLSAFTLIELLIVIAVIGILAGMLFPAIKAVMNSAQGTRVANNGKQIVTAITTANIDREANSKGDIWPTNGKGVTWDNSNAYFARLLGKGGKAELTGINTSMFAGGGVEAAKDVDELESKGCIWSMLANIAVCDDNMPFIWTRNMKKDKGLADTSFNESQESTTDWTAFLDDKETPFGDAQVVLARKGASFQVIKKKDLSASSFLASSTNSSVVIVEAKASTDETGAEF